MSRFDDDTSLREISSAGEVDRRFALEISDGWGIYAFPNGGYLASLLGTALGHALPHPDPFTLTCHYLRPSPPGPAQIDVSVLKRGRGLSTARAELIVDGKPSVHAIATFGDLDARRGQTVEEGGPPSMPDPDQSDVVEAGPGSGSTFGQRVEICYAPGTVPFARGELGGPMELGGWMRFADGREPCVRSLLLFADAMPPPVLRVVPRVWVPTLELTVQVRRRPRPGWLRAWFRTRHLIDGYLEEDGEIYDEGGQLVAVSRQLARVQTS